MKKRKKRIPPYILFLICVALMIFLRWTWPVGVLLRYPINLVGLVPVITGLVSGGAGVFIFLRKRTNIHPFRKPDTLVTTGVFNYSRNPMYLGLCLVLVGAWMLLGAITPILGVLIFVVISDRWYIPPEERMLNEQFGKPYEDYRSRVRRWL